MMYVVPPALEAALHAAARAELGAAPLAPAALHRAIVDRSRRYTSDRDRLAAATDPDGDLAARAVFFSVADAMKLALPLGELAGRGLLPAARPLRVVDLGAGCGAMTLGLLATLAPTELHVTLIDRDARALAIARAAIAELAGVRGAAVTIRSHAADVASAPIPSAELIIAGTLLNELAADRQLAIVERMVAALSPDGALIVVEPALRDTTRALHELRDVVIARGLAHVFAPCTRRPAPCPMLANPDDWCHEHRPLVLPPRTAELARVTHLRDAGMKLSYLVLRRDPTPLVATADGEHAWRLVSAPRIAKGKHEIVGCADPGHVTLRLLRRHRTPANRAVEHAERGDVLVTAAPIDASRVELTAETPVVACAPASPPEAPSPKPQAR
jgi:ribosomal protein RSM22 (predicted rRNA methylase)